jgi:ribosomal protein S18 acetylase RimI-like enzyme
MWVRAELKRAWGSVYIARKGELLDASALKGFVASLTGADIGLVTVANRGLEYEVVSISTTLEGVGVGRALMKRAVDDARASGCRRIWLTTTNNNVRAIGFYQRFGLMANPEVKSPQPGRGRRRSSGGLGLQTASP